MGLALARQALGDEYATLWKFATGRHPPYLNYREMTTRPIPLMLFEAIKETGGEIPRSFCGENRKAG
jgi:hypothetical protein